MKLYIAPGTIALAAAIALEEAGMDHDLHIIHFDTQDQSQPDYLALNPKGRVPALVLQDGAVLTETGAILEYIAAQDPRLMPADPSHAARARSVMYYLASTAHVNHAHKLRGHRWADQATSWADMTAKVPQTMTESATFIENNCIAGPFVLGDHISIADFYLYAVSRWMPGDGVDMAHFPKITAFMSEIETRHSIAVMRAKKLMP